MISTWRSPMRNDSRVQRAKRAIELKAKASSSRTMSSSSRSGAPELDLQGRRQRQISDHDGFTIDCLRLRSSRLSYARLNGLQYLEHVFFCLAATLPVDVIDAQQLNEFESV